MGINDINSAIQAQEAYKREEAFQTERRAEHNIQNQILVELQNQNRQLKADLAKSEKNNRKMLFLDNLWRVCDVR